MTLYNSRGKVVWEMTPQERAFQVGVALSENDNGLTTREIAEMTGLTMTGAWYLMNRMRVPIVQEKGRWKRIE